MRNFDFEPFFRSSIGFDRMLELLDRGLEVEAESAYPPTSLEGCAVHGSCLSLGGWEGVGRE
jgi:molecular chaperone IbpA